METKTQALILAVLPHGENGAVVRALTPDHGLLAGYVHGGRASKLRPVLQPGNRIALHLHSRTATQLATASVELTRSRAGLGLDALSAAIVGWLTSLTADLLTESVAHPPLYAALDGLCDAIEFGAAPVMAAAAVARYELLLLGELGFGLDLGRCAATGASDDLLYVSPRSAQAVSAAAGAPYADKLLPLPPLLRGRDDDVSWADVAAALTTTGFFLTRALLTERHARLRTARDRLVAMVARRAV